MGHARPYDYPTYASESARNMRHTPTRSRHINAAPRHYPLYRDFGCFATNPSQKRIEWWDGACAALRLPYICCRTSTKHAPYPSRSQHINAAPRHYPLYRDFGCFATNHSQKRIEWWDGACAALRLPYICCKNRTTHGGKHSPWSGVAVPRQQQPAPITFFAIWERVVLKTERGCGTGHAGT